MANTPYLRETAENNAENKPCYLCKKKTRKQRNMCLVLSSSTARQHSSSQALWSHQEILKHHLNIHQRQKFQNEAMTLCKIACRSSHKHLCLCFEVQEIPQKFAIRGQVRGHGSVRTLLILRSVPFCKFNQL